MKRMAAPGPVSYRVNVAHLPRLGLPVWLDADEAQRAALAAAHGLQSVESFRLDLTLAPWKSHGVRVTGTVKAAITQSCIITLDPVPAAIDEPVETVLVPEGSKLAAPRWAEHNAEMILDAEGPDAPETFTGDAIDVGALAEEFFALAIDPYPRKEGASIEAVRNPAASDEAEADRGPLHEKLGNLVRKT
jgi:hypothetical protein